MAMTVNQRVAGSSPASRASQSSTYKFYLVSAFLFDTQFDTQMLHFKHLLSRTTKIEKVFHKSNSKSGLREVGSLFQLAIPFELGR